MLEPRRPKRRSEVVRGVAIATVLTTVAIVHGAVATNRLELTPEVGLQRHQQGIGVVTFITIHNPTMMTQSIQSIDATCNAGAVTLGTHPSTVAPGATTMMQVSCGAMLPVGMNRCVFDVRSPDNEILDTFVYICDTSTMPALSYTPTTSDPMPWDFGQVGVGQTSPAKTFTFTKPTIPSVTTFHLQLSDLDGNFLLQSPCPTDTTYCATNHSFGSANPIPVNVVCKPGTSGDHTAQLYAFTSNHFSHSQPVHLKCNGQAAPGPVYDRQPPSVSLAAHVNNATDTVTLTLGNNGGGTVDMNGITFVGANANDWSISSISGPCGNTADCNLAMAETMLVTIDFDPSAIGPRDVTIEIAHDATVDSFTLVGNGQGATATLLSDAAIHFGIVPLNTDRTVRVEIDNQGNIQGSASFMLVGQTAPFSISATAIPLPLATNGTLDVTCNHDQVGVATATLRVIPSPEVVGLPFDIPLTCDLQDTPFYADPSTISLGEIRTGTSPPSRTIQVFGPAVAIDRIELRDATQNLAVTGWTSGVVTNTSFDLEITPTEDELDFENEIIITPRSGAMQLSPIPIQVTGSIVTAAFSAPENVSLGSFCVRLPTMAADVSLQSTGTATIEVSAPTLAAGADSDLELDPAQLATFPRRIGHLATADVAVSPKRRDTPGPVGDTLHWTTDAGEWTSTLSATFIAEGAAVSPDRLEFGQVPIHLPAENATQVHLQNCNEEPIDLDPAMIPAPFSIENGTPPSHLEPGQTAVFEVGFRPTDRGIYMKELVITSPQLAEPLVVTLVGEGIPGDGGFPDDNDLEQTSFYACGCASSRDPSGVLAIALALGCALLPRRRRRRA